MIKIQKELLNCIDNLIENKKNDYQNVDDEIDEIIDEIQFGLLKDDSFDLLKKSNNKNLENLNKKKQGSNSKVLNIENDNKKQILLHLKYFKDTKELILIVEDILKTFKKKQKIETLNKFLTLYNEIKNELNKFVEFNIYIDLNKKLKLIYNKYIDELNLYLNNIMPTENKIKSLDDLKQFNDYISNNGIFIKNYELLALKLKNVINKFFIKKKNFSLELIDEKPNYKSFEILSKESIDFFSLVKSLRNFVLFVNYIDYDLVYKNLGKSLSNILTELISTNIDLILSDEKLLTEIQNLFDLILKRSWKIFDDFFKDKNNDFKNKLVNLNLNILTEKKLIEIKKLFNLDFLQKKKNVEIDSKIDNFSQSDNLIDENNQNWSDSWNSWDEDFENNDKKKNKHDKKNILNNSNSNSIQITSLPNSLIPIIQESKAKSLDLKLILDFIKSSASLFYPSTDESFILINDFRYLSNVLDINDFNEYSESMFYQKKIKFKEKIRNLIFLLKFVNNQKDNMITLDSESDEFLDYDDCNLNNLNTIKELFTNLIQKTNLSVSNNTMLKELMIDLMDFFILIFIKRLIYFDFIKKDYLSNVNQTINFLLNLFNSLTIQLNLKMNDVKGVSKLSILNFIINNPLNDTMERFYQGDLFEFETEELITIIKSLFSKSDIRKGYIKEIVDIRTMK